MGEGLMRRVDGHKFEQEFADTFKEDYYVLRLHTPRKGYTGLTQPADFILLGRFTNFVELKETGTDRLSIKQLQQVDAMQKFVQRKQAEMLGNVEYYLVVHFIKRGVIKVLTAEQALTLLQQSKSLKYDDTVGYTAPNLKQFKEEFWL